jgi:hypothetical protein
MVIFMRHYFFHWLGSAFLYERAAQTRQGGNAIVLVHDEGIPIKA